jgi:dienelactone hydrolase
MNAQLAAAVFTRIEPSLCKSEFLSLFNIHRRDVMLHALNSYRAQPRSLSFIASAVLSLASAHAATVGPSGAAFYNAPAPLPAGTHGELISFRPTEVKLGSDAPAVQAFNVMYLSQDSENKPLPVTGTVLVPKEPVPSGGVRPVILYAVGTHGLGSDCSASKQLASGNDYEIGNINAALKAGYAVLVTDYYGYVNGGTPRYMAGRSQGHNVLDIFKAATSIPGSGLSPSAKVAIWGYSQGGQAAAWAAEVQSSYAPSMNVVAAAHGGTPSNFFETANYLNGRNGAAFLASAIVGLNEEYPAEIPFDLAVSDQGRVEVEKLKQKCVFQAVFDYQNKDIGSYTTPGFTLDKLLQINSVKAVLEDQALGNNPVKFPMYQYHGQADEFIPLAQAYALKQKYCAKGTNLTFDLYAVEHLFTQFQSGPVVLSWLNDRFAGKPTPNSCANNSVPASTSNDNSGNLIVSLKQWPMKLAIRVNLLKQDIVLPPESNFTGDADLNEQLLKNTVVHVPPFLTDLKIIGLSIKAGVKVTDTGATTAKVSVTPDGLLHVHGQAAVNVSLTSLNGIPTGECKGTKPLIVPFDYDGPISAFGSGSINFAGTAALPPFKGCILSGIFTVIVSNWQHGYKFNLAPPSPVRY